MTKAVSNWVDHILPHIYTASAFVNMKHVPEKMQYRFGWGNVWNAQYLRYTL